MSRYLETFLVAHRRLVRESEHRLRLARTLRCAPDSPAVSRLLALASREALGAPDVPRLRGRLVYDLHGEADFSLLPYAPRRIESLRLVHDDHIDYALKRTDRSALDACFARRGGADDVLIVRRGLLTDTTVANLALFDPHTARWYTPARPLLAGAVAFYLVWTALRRSCLLFGRTPLFFARYGLRSRRLGAVLCAIDR